MLAATKAKLFDFMHLPEAPEINSGTGEGKKFKGHELLPAQFAAGGKYRKFPMAEALSERPELPRAH